MKTQWQIQLKNNYSLNFKMIYVSYVLNNIIIKIRKKEKEYKL